MDIYLMPVRAIKNILHKEIVEFRDGFFRAYPSFIMADVQKEMVNLAKAILISKLNLCESYEDLDEFISYAGYKMSLEDWINSL